MGGLIGILDSIMEEDTQTTLDKLTDLELSFEDIGECWRTAVIRLEYPFLVLDTNIIKPVSNVKWFC